MEKRRRNTIAMQKPVLSARTRGDGVIVGLLLTMLFLGNLIHQCGDVELNPGPKDNMRQTRLNSSSVTTVDPSVPDATTPTRTRSTKEPSKGDEILATMQEMRAFLCDKMDNIQSEVSQLRGGQGTLHDLIIGLKDEVHELKAENSVLTEKNNDLTARVSYLELKCDDLENRSRRDNLIFYGIKKVADRESSEDCESLVKDVISNKLKVKDDVQFDRVHRLGPKTDSPIIARCSFYKQKIKILKGKELLKGTNIFIGEDFSQRVRELRRKLTPHLKQARSDGKRVSMVHDHLLIDGKRYTVGDNDILVEKK